MFQYNQPGMFPKEVKAMLIEIDENAMNADIKALIVSDGEKNTLDVSKLKSQADVDRILQSKRYVDSELSTLKTKYKDVDPEQYKELLAKELDANKDIMSNPIYKNLETKYNGLVSQVSELTKEIANRDAAIIDQELKEQLRANTSIQATAVDDLFYRAKTAGFKKKKKGFLNSEGQTLDVFVESLKGTAKHLFKQTSMSTFNKENLKQSLKNNDRTQLFANLRKIQ